MPLSFVIGWSFLDTVMYGTRSPSSASLNLDAILMFTMDVSSNLWHSKSKSLRTTVYQPFWDVWSVRLLWPRLQLALFPKRAY